MFGPLSLRHRLLLLTGITLLPAIVIILVYETSMRSTRMAEAENYVLRTSEIARGEMYRALTGAGTLMIAIGKTPLLLETADECTDYVAGVREELPQILDIAVTDPGGAVHCHDGASAMDDVREALMATVASSDPPRFSIGSYTTTPAGAVLPIVLTMRDAAGAIEGHVLINIGLQTLERIVLGDGFGYNSEVTVVDKGGRVLIHHPSDLQLAGAVLPAIYAELLATGGSGTARLTGVRGTRRIVGFQPPSDDIPFAVFVGLERDGLMAPINRATISSLAAMGGGALVALFLAWFFGRVFIYKPILQILETIQRWRAGEKSARTGVSTEGAELGLIGVSVDGMFDEIARKEMAQQQAERQRDLYAAEVQHRVKNLIAVVQAIISQTLGSKSRSPEVQALRERIDALVRAHSALLSNAAQRQDMAGLVADAIAPFANARSNKSNRIHAIGPPIRLQPKPALALALALHELCTNAVKYGALATSVGHVSIQWEVNEDIFLLSWTEADGPPVQAPAKTGFGTILIRQALEAETSGEVQLDFEGNGLRFLLRAPLDRVAESGVNQQRGLEAASPAAG